MEGLQRGGEGERQGLEKGRSEYNGYSAFSDNLSHFQRYGRELSFFYKYVKLSIYPPMWIVYGYIIVY